MRNRECDFCPECTRARVQMEMHDRSLFFSFFYSESRRGSLRPVALPRYALFRSFLAPFLTAGASIYFAIFSPRVFLLFFFLFPLSFLLPSFSLSLSLSPSLPSSLPPSLPPSSPMYRTRLQFTSGQRPYKSYGSRGRATQTTRTCVEIKRQRPANDRARLRDNRYRIFL